MTERDVKRVILVVEDDVLVRSLIADHLRDAGFAVFEANDAERAIALVKSTVVDLVFTDNNMPGDMDGHSLAAWLLEHRPGLPVILTSGASHASRYTVLGRRFIAKPYDFASVERLIRDLLCIDTRAGSSGCA